MDASILTTLIGGLLGGVGSTTSASAKKTPNSNGIINAIAGVIGGIGGNLALGDTLGGLFPDTASGATDIQGMLGAGTGGLIGGIILSLIVGWIQKKFFNK